MTTTPTENSESKKQGIPWKLIGKIAVPLATAIIAAVATPLGDWVADSLFPKMCTVSGIILKSGSPVSDAHVILDLKHETITGHSGAFVFDQIEAGKHEIRVLAKPDDPDKFVYRDFFAVKSDINDVELSEMELDANPVFLAAKPEGLGDEPVDLDDLDRAPNEMPKPKKASNNDREREMPLPTATAPVTEATSTEQRAIDDGNYGTTDALRSEEPAKEAPVYEYELITLDLIHSVDKSSDPDRPYHVVVWLEEGTIHLDEVESVTYFLHPTFHPDVVSRYDASNRFELVLDIWGQFTIDAVVNFKDGTEMELERYLKF